MSSDFLHMIKRGLAGLQQYQPEAFAQNSVEAEQQNNPASSVL